MFHRIVRDRLETFRSPPVVLGIREVILLKQNESNVNEDVTPELRTGLKILSRPVRTSPCRPT
jgi:hypothetical protein